MLPRAVVDPRFIRPPARDLKEHLDSGIARSTPLFRYSSFTAADEKIPLSMVRVNNKPQHLVFCSHFMHLFSKHCDLSVESFKSPCPARVLSVKLLRIRRQHPLSHYITAYSQANSATRRRNGAVHSANLCRCGQSGHNPAPPFQRILYGWLRGLTAWVGPQVIRVFCSRFVEIGVQALKKT